MVASNKRVKIQIIIGIDKNLNKSSEIKLLAVALGYEISKKFAGCTFWYSGGFWADDGHKYLEEYSGIREQFNLHIHASLLESEENNFLNLLQKNLRYHVGQLNLPIHHIHIEKNIVTENHILL